jgi:uncharacterized protein YigE (DUF2233 family)
LIRRAGGAGLLLLLAAVSLDAQSLAVERNGVWHQWWRASRAPVTWAAALPPLSGAVAWRPGQAGIEIGEVRLSGGGEAWRIRAILVRVDPARVRLGLELGALVRGSRNQWSLRSAPDDAVLAVNAGQFAGAGPWGWVVQDGVERQPPGRGPLAPAVVVGRDGRVRIVAPDAIDAERASGRVAQAFQSYPTLLADDGAVPAPIRTPGRGVDLTHRDSRLGLGELRDGRILIVMTRFEGLGGALDNLPFGLTTPEMAALMGALGCRQAVLLDGGISSQLMVQDREGERQVWRGMRYVPLGLVAVPR